MQDHSSSKMKLLPAASMQPSGCGSTATVHQPVSFGDIDEDVDDSFLSDKMFAEDRQKRAIAEKSWIQARTLLHMSRMATTHTMKPKGLQVGEVVLLSMEG